MGEPTNETEQLLADLTHDATLLRGRLILDHASGDFGRALEDRVALANRVHSDVALLAPILAAMRSRLTVLEQENAELRERLRPEDSRPLSTDPDSSPDWCGCCDAWTCTTHPRSPSETTAP